MKIKLKDIEKKLPRESHSGLELMQWIKINKGNVIEVDSIPSLCKDIVSEVGLKPKKVNKPKIKKEFKGDK